ncbi:MAG: hypothetical protein NTY46_07300 [Candidatus Sumerlaeota bacterium]|nr:hypothetical protein [Candidatus Sumerlaeota bacterium]
MPPAPPLMNPVCDTQFIESTSPTAIRKVRPADCQNNFSRRHKKSKDVKSWEGEGTNRPMYFVSGVSRVVLCARMDFRKVVFVAFVAIVVIFFCKFAISGLSQFLSDWLRRGGPGDSLVRVREFLFFA